MEFTLLEYYKSYSYYKNVTEIWREIFNNLCLQRHIFQLVNFQSNEMLMTAIQDGATVMYDSIILIKANKQSSHPQT